MYEYGVFYMHLFRISSNVSIWTKDKRCLICPGSYISCVMYCFMNCAHICLAVNLEPPDEELATDAPGDRKRGTKTITV